MLSKDFRTLGCVLGTQTPCLKKKLKNCVGCRYFIYSVKDLGAGSTFGIAKNAEKIPIAIYFTYGNVYLSIEGRLLYNVLVSAVQQCESAISVHISPPS